MKQILPVFLLSGVSFLFSCSHYSQIFYTSPTSAGISKSNTFVFENDTIKIVYSFWKENGVLAYSILNKLNTPIYIDWKKSSFIANGIKLNYWQDETISKSASASRSYNSSYFGYYGILGISEGTNITSGRFVKPERITFLAPRSSIIKADFDLFSPNAKLPKNSPISTINKPGTNNLVPISYKEYSQPLSPLVFRNFLTISMSENFEKEIYVDNGFYVSRVTQMKSSDFLGYYRFDKKAGKTLHELPFKDPTIFYVKVNN